MRKWNKIDKNGKLQNLFDGVSSEVHTMDAINKNVTKVIKKCSEIIAKPNELLDSIITSSCDSTSSKFVICFSFYILMSCPKEYEVNSKACTDRRYAARKTRRVFNLS